MIKWYATITNLKTGRQFTVGEYSEKDLHKTLNDVQKVGRENLDECQVYIYTVQI